MVDQKLDVCVFLVPTAYNDGRPVESSVIAQIGQALDRQFGGWTQLGPQKGSWYGKVEQSLAIKVAIHESQVEALITMVKAIGARLGQKAMYFERFPSCAQLLTVPDNAEGDVPTSLFEE